MVKLKITLIISYMAMVAHVLSASTDERVHLSALSKPSDIETIVLSDFPLGTKKRVVLKQIHKKYFVYGGSLVDQNGFLIEDRTAWPGGIKNLILILDRYLINSIYEPLCYKELRLWLEFDDTDSLINVNTHFSISVP